MLLARIWWEQDRDSLFYIPVEVFEETAAELFSNEYLGAATGTNHRGVKAAPDFMGIAEAHAKTIRVPINWQHSGIDIEPPLVRRTRYWKEVSFFLDTGTIPNRLL